MQKPRRGEKGQGGRVLLGLRGYARHRKEHALPGGTHSAIQKAFSEGRIRKSCKVHDRCPDNCESVDQGFDPAVADLDWEQTTIAKPGAGDESLNEAQRLKTLYQARLLRLKHEREVGNLVAKADVEAERLLAGQQVQKAMMQLCKRVAVRCASLAEPRAVQDYLEEEVRRALSRAGVAIQRAPR